MSISQKCNCCIKESVCKFKNQYEYACEKIKKETTEVIEVSIKCKEFVTKSQTRGNNNEL